MYAYRSSHSLPRPADTPALTWLVGELRRRSPLVLIDGVDARSDLPTPAADVRVLVAEPTARDAGRAGRLVETLGSEPPLALIQNRTRKLPRAADILTPHVAGSPILPEIEVPFEPSLTAIAGRGWPGDRVPSSLTGPLSALVDRVLSPAFAIRSAAAMQAGGG